MKKIGFQLGGSFESIFNMIFGDEYKWYHVLLISGILLYDTEGIYVLLYLVVDPRYHVVHINI